MLHPYAHQFGAWDITRMIEVEIEGETFNGEPHGFCLLNFIYNEELHVNQWS
jgi:hypothetical protein